MSSQEEEKKEPNAAAPGAASEAAAEAQEIVIERQVKEAVIASLKSKPDFVRVIDIAKQLSGVSRKAVVGAFEKLVEKGILEKGNTSASPTMRHFTPSAKARAEFGIATAPESGPTAPESPQDKILGFIGDGVKTEVETKKFAQTLGFPSKKAAKNFLADLVAGEKISLGVGGYRKFTPEPLLQIPVVAEPVATSEPVATISSPEQLAPVRPLVERAKAARSEIISMMNRVEGERRRATDQERATFYANLSEFLRAADAAVQSGLVLPPEAQEQRRWLSEIDGAEEKRVEDEMQFRRSVIGLANTLSTQLRTKERQLSKPEPTPVAADQSQPSAEELRTHGKDLEQARVRMFDFMHSVRGMPTEEQVTDFRAQLGKFVETSKKMRAGGLLLSNEATADYELLARINNTGERIYNERRVRQALQRINDELFTQVESLAGGNNKSEAPIGQPLISSARFPDDKYHGFGNFDKFNYAGVYMGHDKSNDDAFAVNERAVAVGDGIGQTPLGGLLSRHFTERLAARAKRQISYDEFQALFTESSLAALLTVIKDDPRYERVRHEAITNWNSTKHSTFAWEKVYGGKSEAGTTFSVIRESDDGSEIYYAALGDSPIIVVDRDSSGAVIGWRLLNEQGPKLATTGEQQLVDITDRSVYDSGIIRDLKDHYTSGVGLTATNVEIFGYKELVVGRIPKKENQLIITATDGLTKLLTKSPAAYETQARFLDELAGLTDEQFLAYIQRAKDGRFVYALNPDGTLDAEKMLDARKSIRDYAESSRKEAEKIKTEHPKLWNADGSLNMIAALKVPPKELEFAGDDVTFIVSAAGKQTAPLPKLATALGASPSATPDSSLPAKEVETSNAEGPESFNSYEHIIEPLMLRARAAMVLEILKALPADNPEKIRPLNELLVTKLSKEIVEAYYANKFLIVPSLRKLLPALRQRLTSGGDLLSAEEGKKRTTWQKLAERLSGGMNEVAKMMDAAWVAQNPGVTDDDFFDFEGTNLHNEFSSLDQWLADLKTDTSINPELKQALQQALISAKEKAQEKLEQWSNAKLDGASAEKAAESLTEEEILNQYFRARLHAPLSKDLPENPAAKTDPLGVEYGKILASYSTPWKETDAYDALHPTEKKTDFIDKKDANIGWKFHLNVLLENVAAVSQYLKANGYAHKYLHGGEPEDGKIFTVYIGSYGLAERLAKIISTDLAGKLAKPLASGEIELAPGVVGRFSGGRRSPDKPEFHQYGLSGFTLLKADLDRIWGKLHLPTEERDILREYYDLRKSGKTKEIEDLLRRDSSGVVRKYIDDIDSAEKRAFRALQAEYGDYFFSAPAEKGSVTDRKVSATSAPEAGKSVDTPAAPAAAPKKRLSITGRPLKVEFANGNFNVSMAEAFSNDVFYSFFQKFDGARHPGNRFDATLPGHDERYEKAMEAYVLWREAVSVFTREIAQTVEQDIGLKPHPEALSSIEIELERLVIANTQQVRRLIDDNALAHSLEEDEARKENEIFDLGGQGALLTQLDELERLRQEQRLRVKEFTDALHLLSRQRSDAARALDVQNRGRFRWSTAKKNESQSDRALRFATGSLGSVGKPGISLFGAVMDRLRGVFAPTRIETSSGVRAPNRSTVAGDVTSRAMDRFIQTTENNYNNSFIGSTLNRLRAGGAAILSSAEQRFKGLLRGREAVDLERKLQTTYGMSLSQAAEVYPDIQRRESLLQLQTEQAINEYERIEKLYQQIRSRTEHLQSAEEQKQQISNQLYQFRMRIFGTTEGFRTAARLTAGRARDMVKELLDPATATDRALPGRVQKAEKQLAGLRRAADFRFSGERYLEVPEIVSDSIIEQSEVIADADRVINEAVESHLRSSLERFAVSNSKSLELLRKTFLAYGKRGFELGEEVLAAGIHKAEEENDTRRANVLQALLFELRVANT